MYKKEEGRISKFSTPHGGYQWSSLNSYSSTHTRTSFNHKVRCQWLFTLALFVFSEFLAISLLRLSSVHAFPLPERFSELVVRGKGDKDSGLEDSSKGYGTRKTQASTSFESDTVNGVLTPVPSHHQALQVHTPHNLDLKSQDTGTIFFLPIG